MTNSLPWFLDGPLKIIEIDGLPNWKMVDLSMATLNNQMVAFKSLQVLRYRSLKNYFQILFQSLEPWRMLRSTPTDWVSLPQHAVLYEAARVFRSQNSVPLAKAQRCLGLMIFTVVMWVRRPAGNQLGSHGSHGATDPIITTSLFSLTGMMGGFPWFSQIPIDSHRFPIFQLHKTW